NWSAEECARRLGEAIDASVRRQMISDVPIGALLSGGLDSSAVVRSMRRSDATSIETFTIGFDESSFDESPYAAQVAEIYGTKHHADRVSADVVGLLGTLVSHAEEPFADNSMIPFYLLSQQVRQHVIVALSGDGADELMGGYDTYRASQWAPYYRMLPGFLRRGAIAPIVNRLPSSTKKYALPSLLRRFVAAADQPSPRDHCSWRRYVSAELRNELYTDRFKQDATSDPISQYAAALDDAPPWLSPLEQRLHVDMQFHLPNDMLVKVDRMSMAHGLEVRVPLLDDEVIRTCLAMPSNERRQGKQGKLPLRRLLRDDLPPELIDRKKAGFLSPIERWLQGPWQPLLRDLLNDDFVDQTGAFQMPALQKMIDDQMSGRADHAYPLFALLVFAIWWRIWITQEWPDQTHRPDAKPTRVTRLD
ncbi:MAG: hypothetical protein HKN47_19220, partial [Pirellulaceae bacterium]|nr:hypothetical protein [Pirellulaceae bacterium]